MLSVVCCGDQWAERIPLMLYFSRSYSQPGDQTAWWVTRNLLLHPADQYQQIYHCCLFPKQLTKQSLCVTVDLYWRIEAVHIYSTSKSCNKFWHSLSFIKQSRAHSGSKTHLYSSVLAFMLTLSPLGVAGLKPLNHKSYKLRILWGIISHFPNFNCLQTKILHIKSSKS